MMTDGCIDGSLFLTVVRPTAAAGRGGRVEAGGSGGRGGEKYIKAMPRET